MRRVKQKGLHAQRLGEFGIATVDTRGRARGDETRKEKGKIASGLTRRKMDLSHCHGESDTGETDTWSGFYSSNIILLVEWRTEGE